MSTDLPTGPDDPDAMTYAPSAGADMTYAMRTDSQILLGFNQKPAEAPSMARHRSVALLKKKENSFSEGMCKTKSDPSVHRPPTTCEICKQAWPSPQYVDFLADMPKNILPGSERPSAADFQPATQDCVVATHSWDRKTGKSLLPVEVFQNLSLTHTPEIRQGCQIRHRLVKDFEYDCENGVCLYDKSVSEDETKNFKYAQLVTLNNWYNMLVAHMMRVVLQSLSLSVSIMLMAILPKEEFAKECTSALNKASLRVFICLVSGLYAIAIYSARSAALWQWHSLATPIVGDLVNNSYWLDRNLTFSAMVFFNFFQIEKLLKDMPIYLHPWKSVQPYAAMKVENSRVHIVGFESKHFFNVVKNSGHQNVLYIMTLNHTLQLLFNFHVLIWHANPTAIWTVDKAGSEPNCTLPEALPQGQNTENRETLGDQIQDGLGTYVFSFVIACMSCFVSWYLCIQEVFARSHMRNELIAMLSSSEASEAKGAAESAAARRKTAARKSAVESAAKSAAESAAASEAKSAAARKLLALHFHQKWEDGQLTKISLKKHVEDGRRIFQKKNKCSKCGRVIAEPRGSVMGSLIEESLGSEKLTSLGNETPTSLGSETPRPDL